MQKHDINNETGKRRGHIKHEETSERIKTLGRKLYDGKYFTKNNFMFKIICPVICLFNCTVEIYFCQTFQYMARHCLVLGRYFEP